MNRPGSRWLLLLVFLTTATGCDVAADPATRLAYDLEAGTGRWVGRPVPRTVFSTTSHRNLVNVSARIK